ncbi:MAG: family 16 glycosylhydrolase [Mangrovibacterium sp.]
MKTSKLFARCMLILILSITQTSAAVEGREDARSSQKMYNVPDLTGLPQAQAEAVLSEAGLAVGTVTGEYNNSVPIGSVTCQNPAAGSSVTKGTMVNLRLSAYVPFGGSGVFTELVWQEEFNDTPNGLPDSNNWKFDTGFFGKADKSDYCLRGNRKENCYIQNGVLHLRVTNERCYCTPKSVWRNYSSASIRTQDLHYWTHGRFEVRAKLPSVNGTWPAIWMGAQERGASGYGSWPRWGEIDIMEAYGKKQGNLSYNLHTLLYYSGSGNKYHGSYDDNSIYDDFHVYSIEWFPDRFDWYFDDQLVYTAKKHDPARRPLSAVDSGEETWKYWPFDKPFFFWLSLQYARPSDMLTEADIALLPQVFEVDYVRVYQSSEISCTKYP